MEKLVLSAFLTLSLIACASKKDELTKDIASFEVLSGDAKPNNDGYVEGSGVLRFSDTPGTRFSTVIVDLEAKLKVVGSAVTVVSHSSKADLTDGFRVMIMRKNNGLGVTLTLVGGASVKVLDARLAAENNVNIAWHVEVQNSNAGLRVIAWPLNTARVTGDAAIFDTAEASHLATSFPNTPAPGFLMGMVMSDAILKRATLH